ncbi:tetratricopeptide repeat protein 6 [Limosa lapponica baueri]|uniref:Tetratricopeptide repeat protein 6 n=1 Tax=Limosa lapponica baueri TaxID=1758121 RepID=A0A2I0UJA3_LIMLA|nr:tetratricopeptide repeat protein 6 [Limosa lapponica baueri]
MPCSKVAFTFLCLRSGAWAKKTKSVIKIKDRVHMLQMDPQNLKRDKSEEIDTVFKDSDEFSSTDSDTSKNISRKGKITRESCEKGRRVISKAKQQDLDVESGRVLRKGSKQPSVRSAQEQLEEVRDVTRRDTSKIYEKNFQQSKPEEPTSTPALPVKVVARSIDEIIASLQSTSPSPSDQTIKELLESVLGQNYNIKMEKTPVVQKESQAAGNESRPEVELLTYKKQVKQVGALTTETVMSPLVLSLGCMTFAFFSAQQHNFLYPEWSNNVMSNVIEDGVFQDLFTDHEEELEAEQDDHGFYDYELVCITTSLIKRSVSALEITAFKDETTLKMSANFKISMKELKVMKQQIAEPEVETEIAKSSPAKHLLNQICGDPQSMRTDRPVEKMLTLTGQEDSENDIVLVERPQKAGIKYTDFSRRKKTKKSMKIRNPRKLEDVIKKLNTYLSMAEIYRKQGDNTLAIISYSSAIQHCPTDDDIYFRRAELYFEENQFLLAMDDYAKCFQYNPKRTDALMKHGIHFFDHSVLTTAIQDFTAVIKEDPSNAQARLYRGRAYAKQQQYRNAIQDLATAIHLDPSCWLAFYYRGCILQQIDPKRAVQDFSVSVLINDTQENFCSFLHRGIVYSEQHQWSLAISDFESVLALDSSVVFAYLNIGLILLLHLNQSYEAIQWFTNAIETDPLTVRAYICRAQAYHKIHNLQNAVKDINRAIHLYPNKSQLYILRGQYLMELKKYELASLCIHQLAEMDEESFTSQPVQRALVQSFCQNHDKAIECLREATAIQPEPSVFVILGKIQMKAKKTKDAVRSFKKAMKLLMTSTKILPNTFEAAEIYYLTGLCHMEQKNLLRAHRAFSMAIRLHSSYPDAFYQRGLCRMQLRQAKCIQDFNQALALCPSHFQAYMSRAAYYGSKGRYSKAILNCNEAIKILPNSVQAYFYRGTLKYQNKTFKAAIEDFSKTIDLDKTSILAYYNRAVCYHQIKDFRKALKDYGILLLLELSEEIAYKVLINRGLLFVELGDHASACEDFKEATLLSPDDSQVFQAIGICCHRLHEFEEAVRSFDQVLKLDPISVDAYVGRGNSYMENGHETGYKQAQKDFLRAIHLNPTCINARICLGYNLQCFGKYCAREKPGVTT